MCCLRVTIASILWSTIRFFFQAEDGIRDLVRSRGLGDVYKRQAFQSFIDSMIETMHDANGAGLAANQVHEPVQVCVCLLYTSDAADERSSVDLGGRRIIKKKNNVD